MHFFHMQFTFAIIIGIWGELMKINQETKKNILTITYAGVVLFVILYFSKVIGFLASIWQLLVPFIIGFAITFVLNIIKHQAE